MKDKKSPKENQSRENNKDEVKNNKKYKKHLNKIKKVQQLNFQENISNDTMVLTRRNRCLVFTNLVILNILVNMDHGTIPAATEEISKYLGIDKSTIGLYGSLAFFGALLGSFISMPLMNYKKRKIILVISLTINFTSTFLLPIREKYTGAILRVIVGVSQSFLAIYSPVWVDQFGNKKSKTIMMAFQQVSGPLGIVSGYIITFLVKKKWMWYWGLIIQAIGITICVTILLFIDTKYFSYDFFTLKKDKLQEQSVKGKIEKNINQVESQTKKYFGNKNHQNKNIVENLNNNKFNQEAECLDNNDNDKHKHKHNDNDEFQLNIKNVSNKKNQQEDKVSSEPHGIGQTSNLSHNRFLVTHDKMYIEDINNDNKLGKINEINAQNNSPNKNSLINSANIIIEENSAPNANDKSKNLMQNNINLNDAGEDYELDNVQKSGNANKNRLDKAKEEDEISIFYKKNEMVELTAIQKFKEFFRNVKLIIREKVYVFAVISVAILNFISTAIQYWVSDHLKKVMRFDEDEIFICFVITCVTAPTLGVIFGGYVVQKFGGYESRNSIIFCLCFAIIAGCDAILILFQEKIIGFSIVLWVFLFFGGAIIPNMIGIFISSLPNELRAFGNSFSTTAITLLGQLPAPYVYGAIYSIDERKKTAFNLTMLYSWAGVLFILITLIIRMKKFKKQENSELLSNQAKAVEIRSGSELQLEQKQNHNHNHERLETHDPNIKNFENEWKNKEIPLENTNNYSNINQGDDTRYNASAIKDRSKICENDISIINNKKNETFNKFQSDDLIEICEYSSEKQTNLTNKNQKISNKVNNKDNSNISHNNKFFNTQTNNSSGDNKNNQNLNNKKYLEANSKPGQNKEVTQNNNSVQVISNLNSQKNFNKPDNQQDFDIENMEKIGNSNIKKKLKKKYKYSKSLKENQSKKIAEQFLRSEEDQD